MVGMQGFFSSMHCFIAFLATESENPIKLSSKSFTACFVSFGISLNVSDNLLTAKLPIPANIAHKEEKLFNYKQI